MSVGVYEREVGKFVSAAEVAAHPWAFRCAVEGCFYGVCAASVVEAELEQARHRCPRNGDPMSGASLVEQAWAQLDKQVDEIYAGGQLLATALEQEKGGLEVDLAIAKGRARGKAEILALFMIPHFHTTDEIADEAGRRLQARLTGNVHYETKGLGSRRTEF